MSARGVALVALALSACGGATAVPTRSTGIALSYDVAIDPALETMRVSLCPVDAPLPAALVPIHDEARDHLRAASLTEDGRVVRTLVPSARIDLTDTPADACVTYEIDLSTCVSPRGPTGCGRSGRDLFAPTSVWLLAPETRRLAARYALRFTLPEGVTVTPLAEGASTTTPEDLVLDDRSFAFVTYLAFVHEAPRRIAVPGGCVDVVTLDGALDASFASETRWISEAAAASTRVTGQAPFAHLTALVIPTFDVPAMPVLFGVAGRGMRPSVTLLVSEHAREAALVPDWTLVHELSHFLTAYLDGEDTWLSEGLATYYEEVLRARQGLISERDAWAALTNGFARGAAEPATCTIREASAGMHESRAYTRVYWAGAAIALLADVAYRRAGSSLDEAIARAWDHRTEHATAAQLVAWLDGAPDGPLAAIVARTLDESDFPPVEESLAWLGVTSRNGQVVLDADAPGAALRDAMMNGGAPVASNPASCDASP